MSDRPHLETAGTLREYPLAELIVEIGQAGLSGSLRVSNAERKSVVYFRDGKLVFAASNEKRHRLIHLIIEQKIVTPGSLAKCPKGANDVELAGWLKSEGLLSAKEIWDLTLQQVESIVIESLSWTEGDWLFSPLARIRSEMECPVNLQELMLNYARCIPLRTAAERFRSVNESFIRSPRRLDEITLLEHEAFLLTLFDRDPITIEIARASSAMPEEGMLQGLYALWLGGLLERRDWNAAFSKNKISEIKRAKLAVAKPAREMAAEPKAAEPPEEPQVTAIPELNISLEDYLERVESAVTHYEVLGIEQTAELAEVKNAYFGAAKMFHPDRFHREEEALLARVQAAFTSLAHAYETLKSPESRQSYNRKMASEAEKITRRKAAGEDKASVIRDESAKESYEEGLKALENGDAKSAATHFARAVHYEPDTALYHAYYGKAMSFAQKLKHQAEAELQKAGNLAPKDVKVRLMLVDFYEDMNLPRRAEGELRRILETLPSNREVRERLARMGVAV
jgi:hypothetical protein